MRKLIVIATLLLGTFALAQPKAHAMQPAKPANPNTYDQIQAVLVEGLISARLKVAPCPCEASEAYFITIGETYPEPVASNVEQQGTADDFYSQLLVAQVDHYLSIRATIALPKDSDAALPSLAEAEPASMASNSEKPGTDQDSYNQTIAAQSYLHRLVEAVNRF